MGSLVSITREESACSGTFLLVAHCPCGWEKWQQESDRGVLTADIEGHSLRCSKSQPVA